MVDHPVLIIGAGPTGLILANELLRRGISVRQVDKRPTPSGSTRAFTIHARTMEMFEHIGVAPKLQELQEICPGNRFHFKGLDIPHQDVPATDFRQLKSTRFNYYGKINQNDLEEVLRDHLLATYDHVPEWNVECMGVNNDLENAHASITHHADDRQEIATASWLVGADGVRSIVRSALGGSFEHNESYLTTMSMADIKLRCYNGDDAWVNYYTSDQGFLLITHLPGNVHRVYLTGEMQKKLTEMEIPAAYQWGLDFYDTGAKIDEVVWSSTWQIHKIIGDVYRQDRIILCGDATHVHSPSGGQGMNACLQDAFNLGWKLSAVVNGDASEGLLETYQKERKPIAEQVTEGANRIHQIVINHEIPVQERFKLTQNDDWHSSSIYSISGLAHSYRAFTDTPAAVSILDSPIQPGDRAANAMLTAGPPELWLHDLLRHPNFTALLLPASSGDLPACDDLKRRLQSNFATHVESVIIVPSSMAASSAELTINDELRQFDAAYASTGVARLILIRPDLVVGYQSTLTQAEYVFDFMESLLSGSQLSA